LTEYPEDPLKPLSETEREENRKKTEETKKQLLGDNGSNGYSLPLIESFRWLTPDIFKTQDFGKKAVKIKGVALRSNTISKNQRKYVEKELAARGSTLTNTPFDVNHDSKKRIGHVEYAEYEDGALEYLVKVHKEPYVTMIREKDPRIRGVSVSAHYLFNKCPECGEKFLSEEDWQYHMEKVHLRKDLATEVHGLTFDGLTLVVAPEEPGVEDTTIEIYETSPGCNRLFEIIAREKRGVVMKQKVKTRTRSNKQVCEEFGLEMNRLGEPFADYPDFDACVSANQDKEDPEAYCADIMRKTEEQEENPEDIKPGSHYCEEHPDDPRCKAHKKAIHGDLEETFNEWIEGANKTIKHYGECIDKLQGQVHVLENPKSLTETVALTEKVNKLQVDVDNLDVHLQRLSKFKGHSKESKSEPEEYAEDPLEGGK